MTVDIEPLHPDDWEAVRRIYLEGLATGNASFETDAPPWEVWDAGHLPHSRLVAREDGQVLGWVALSPVSKRSCYAGVAEVSLYVAATSRRKGIGRLLLDAVIRAAEQRGIWTLQGGTFAENAASLALQQACGFRIVGRRERIGKLNGVWRDTILTERRSAVAGLAEETTVGKRHDQGG